MCAETDDRCLALERARNTEQVPSLSGICPTFIEVGQEPPRTFDPEHCLAVETGRHEFGLQFLRPMEICRGEVIPLCGFVAVLSLLEVFLHNRGEGRICEEIPREAVQG